MSPLLAFFYVICLKMVFSENISEILLQMEKDNGGLPYGLLSDCPGLNKPVVIRKTTLKRLTISVQYAGLPFVAKRVTYNYFQMNKLVKNPSLNLSAKTMMYVGGYSDDPNLPMARVLGKIYNDLGYNVLLLDTSNFTTVMYPLACRQIRQAAYHAAEMIANITSLGLDVTKFELLGLSLGGQTAGFIGKHFYTITGRKLPRITALDPSGPCFRHLPPENRLSPTDAEFVNVVYTNIDGWGMAKPMGHVNFYVNGGEFQPGEFSDMLSMACNIECSHGRSFTIWISSLLHPKKFIAIKCDSVQMARNHDCYDRVPLETNMLGINVNQSLPGIYYLTTDNNYPYGLGKRGLRKEFKYWESHLKVYNEADLVTL